MTWICCQPIVGPISHSSTRWIIITSIISKIFLVICVSIWAILLNISKIVEDLIICDAIVPDLLISQNINYHLAPAFKMTGHINKLYIRIFQFELFHRAKVMSGQVHLVNLSAP